jgi:uncharacterized protein (DUF1810 family)
VGDLERFVEAQNSGAAFETALAEIRAGRKRGHWIWYVFPQLSGLGMSHMSRVYGIRDLDEAEEYLRHPVLAQRLLTISTAVAEQIRRGVPLETLMGSPIDATKLVSSLTLFRHAAARLNERGEQSQAGALAAVANEILEAAATQGYPVCQRTLAAITK